MNVLYVTPWYPTADHPYAGVFVREYAKAVSRHVRVVVLHLAPPDESLEGQRTITKETDETLTEGVPTYRVTFRRSAVPGLSRLRRRLTAVGGADLIAQEHGRIDVIHAHVFSSWSAAKAISLTHRVPIVLSEHHSGFLRSSLSGRQIRVARRAFSEADLVLPVSQALRMAIEGWCNGGRMRTVPNVVDTTVFSFDASASEGCNRPVRMVTVTSSHPHKGLQCLLGSLAKVRWGSRDWRLDIIGVARNEVDSQRWPADSLDESHVHFHGRLPKGQVAALMRQASFFVLPSLVETFSVATAEAMATGLPVVATKCGGPGDFVDSECGVLVVPGSEEALARGISQMIENLGAFDRAAIAKKAGERFGAGPIGKSLSQLYAEVLSESRHGRRASRLRLRVT